MTKKKPPAGANEPTVTSPELVSLAKLVVSRLDGGGAPPYLLNALIGAAKAAMATPVDTAFIENPPPEWTPKPGQIWTPMMRDGTGRRITAWDMFEQSYATIPFAKRPYAHQVRQHPKTKQFYDSLCVIVSRNKKKGKPGPKTIAELFPTTPQARGGVLSDSKRRLT